MLRVMLDANVIVSSWTLDVLLSLGDLGMIDPSWSEKILEEYLRAMEGLKRRDAAEKKMTAANQAFPSAMVYGVGLPEGIELPDPDDRHVVAAALVGECDCIVTYNLRDFPQEALDKYGLRAMSPDDLVMELVESNPVRSSVSSRAWLGRRGALRERMTRRALGAVVCVGCLTGWTRSVCPNCHPITYRVGTVYGNGIESASTSVRIGTGSLTVCGYGLDLGALNSPAFCCSMQLDASPYPHAGAAKCRGV